MAKVCFCGEMYENERDVVDCTADHFKNGFEDDPELKERLALIFNLTLEEIIL